MWTPDVYEGAPTPVTAFMSTGVKAAAFAALARVFVTALGDLQGSWAPIFWAMAVVTMTVGNLAAIAQQNIKRMLAYSSIAHAGYLLIALVAAGPAGLTGLLYYLLAYAFMNLGAFAVVVALEQREDRYLHLDDYSGLGFRYPLLGVAMALFMFSLSGLPPTAGFMAKFYVFGAAVEQGYLVLTVIGVLNSLISTVLLPAPHRLHVYGGSQSGCAGDATRSLLAHGVGADDSRHASARTLPVSIARSGASRGAGIIQPITLSRRWKNACSAGSAMIWYARFAAGSELHADVEIRERWNCSSSTSSPGSRSARP